jgi:DNA-binding transcriptional ArsR family regulator
MAFSKAHRFDPVDYHYTLILKALNHPARLAIVRKLYNEGPLSVKEIRKDLMLSQPSVSQHLQILREMQILNCEQKFPTVTYWLNQDLPNTYNCVIDVLKRAGLSFDTLHIQEIEVISRFGKATADGV